MHAARNAHHGAALLNARLAPPHSCRHRGGRARAGAALGESFGNYLASGANERLGTGILRGLGDKAMELKKPIQKKRKKNKPPCKARRATAAQ